MLIERFKRGTQDKEMSERICKDCNIKDYSSLYTVLKNMYHVDTYEAADKWRPQGYVFIHEYVNEDVELPGGEISVIGDKYILFFTLNLKKQ